MSDCSPTRPGAQMPAPQACGSGGLKKVFEGRTLDNAMNDLLDSGWIKVEGNWGSKTVFQKQVGNDKFYAMWEPANMEHSADGSPTSYWKITKGRMSARGYNVRRVSNSSNFKN